MSHLLSLGNFYGIDSLIDIFIVTISLLIFAQSKKIYKIIKEKNFNYFSYAFLSIAIAYFFKIIINLTFVYSISLSHIEFQHCISCIIEQFETIQIIDLFSMILLKTFLIGGFIILFLVSTKGIDKKHKILFAYSAGIIILSSIYFDFIFNLTIVLTLITLIIHFYKNFKKTNSKYSKLIFYSFIPILISNLLGIFYEGGTTGYLIQEILLLIGFSILFFTHSKFIIKNEKKNKT